MPTDLGLLLRVLIARRGHRSVAAAARAAGLSKTQLHDLVRGRRSPTVETLDRVVTALGGTLGELFAEAGPR